MEPPKPGTYRAIFQKALVLYMQTEGTRMNDQELSDCGYYLTQLDDPAYKFGKFTTGQQTYTPGELFLRS